MAGKGMAGGLDLLRKASIMYFVGLLLITIANTVAASTLRITASVFFTVVLGAAFFIGGGSFAQRGYDMLKEKSRAFALPATLGPMSLIAGVVGAALFLLAVPSPLFLEYSPPSVVYLPTPIQAEMAMYGLFSVSHQYVLALGVLCLAIGVLSGVLAASIGMWRTGRACKSGNLMVYGVAMWLPVVGMFAFLLAYFEMSGLIKAANRSGRSRA